MNHILVVDDDKHIREVVSFALTKAGMHAIESADGKQALKAFDQHRPDLIVLDINLPEINGLEVCREIRKTSDVPILFLSSREDEIDRILGLELGADDYVTKPFSPRELVARINSILKRTRSTQKAEAPIITEGFLTIDPHKYKAYWNQQPIELTTTEFSLLKAIASHPSQVLNRDQLINIAYRDNHHISDRTIDSHIRHVRHKFLMAGCQSIIKTVRGIGYILCLQ